MEERRTSTQGSAAAGARAELGALLADFREAARPDAAAASRADAAPRPREALRCASREPAPERVLEEEWLREFRLTAMAGRTVAEVRKSARLRTSCGRWASHGDRRL